ncbi:hypothetical protein Tco_0385020 [Tanacetum coccineum]
MKEQAYNKDKDQEQDSRTQCQSNLKKFKTIFYDFEHGSSESIRNQASGEIVSLKISSQTRKLVSSVAHATPATILDEALKDAGLVNIGFENPISLHCIIGRMNFSLAVCKSLQSLSIFLISSISKSVLFDDPIMGIEKDFVRPIREFNELQQQKAQSYLLEPANIKESEAFNVKPFVRRLLVQTLQDYFSNDTFRGRSLKSCAMVMAAPTILVSANFAQGSFKDMIESVVIHYPPKARRCKLLFPAAPCEDTSPHGDLGLGLWSVVENVTCNHGIG